MHAIIKTEAYHETSLHCNGNTCPNSKLCKALYCVMSIEQYVYSFMPFPYVGTVLSNFCIIMRTWFGVQHINIIATLWATNCCTHALHN